MTDRKLLLIVMDGFGIGPLNEHNAIYQAQTPFFDSLVQKYPHTTLDASGEAVGTLPGQIGTSEVGHLTIGAGRVVYQDISRIHASIDDGTFFKNTALQNAIDHVKKYGGTLHIIGLISPGGVHSHTKHLYALLKLAHTQGMPRVAIHAFLDGRDTPPSSGLEYIQKLENVLRTFPPSYLLTTIMGRFFGMDRNHNWERTKYAFETITKGAGLAFKNATEVIRDSYNKGVSDEFIPPCVLLPKESPYFVHNNDSIIFFNFRADRMRQLTSLFLNQSPEIIRHDILNLCCTTMTSYTDVPQGISVAYPTQIVRNHLSEILSAANIRQYKIAETEKYAHLTYFLNGGREAAYPNEERLMVPSQKVVNFSETPQMSSKEITDEALRALSLNAFPFIALNLCNADMLGHTGDIKAAINGITFLDHCLARLIPEAQIRGYETIITADHGNAEEMYIPEINSTHTAHTLNKVPLIIVSNRVFELKQEGGLANVAPTILELLHLKKPAEMTTPSLIANGTIL